MEQRVRYRINQISTAKVIAILESVVEKIDFLNCVPIDVDDGEIEETLADAATDTRFRGNAVEKIDEITDRVEGKYMEDESYSKNVQKLKRDRRDLLQWLQSLISDLRRDGDFSSVIKVVEAAEEKAIDRLNIREENERLQQSIRELNADIESTAAGQARLISEAKQALSEEQEKYYKLKVKLGEDVAYVLEAGRAEIDTHRQLNLERIVYLESDIDALEKRRELAELTHGEAMRFIDRKQRRDIEEAERLRERYDDVRSSALTAREDELSRFHRIEERLAKLTERMAAEREENDRIARTEAEAEVRCSERARIGFTENKAARAIQRAMRKFRDDARELRRLRANSKPKPAAPKQRKK